MQNILALVLSGKVSIAHRETRSDTPKGVSQEVKPLNVQTVIDDMPDIEVHDVVMQYCDNIITE